MSSPIPHVAYVWWDDVVRLVDFRELHVFFPLPRTAQEDSQVRVVPWWNTWSRQWRPSSSGDGDKKLSPESGGDGCLMWMKPSGTQWALINVVKME